MTTVFLWIIGVLLAWLAASIAIFATIWGTVWAGIRIGGWFSRRRNPEPWLTPAELDRRLRP
jgi:hypothetical protein